MLKLCGCFKTPKDKEKTLKPINKIKEKKTNVSFGLLLAGDDESGKIKLLKELVASHDSFTLKDKVLKTSEIERYIRDSLTDILHAFEESDPAIPLKNPANQRRIDYILMNAQGEDFEYSLEFFEQVELLWADVGLQTFFKKCNPHQFPDSAKYFLDHVSDIRDPDYIPTTEDMIHARLVPSDIFKMSFEFEKERIHLDVLEMDILSEEHRESLQTLVNQTSAVVFITDLNCFDRLIDEETSQTQLHQSLEQFRTIRTNKLLETTSVILLLNKQNLLAKKIKNGVRLEKYFPDFANYVCPQTNSQDNHSEGDAEVTRAKSFLRDQFLTINPDCHWHYRNDSDITVRSILDALRMISTTV